MNVKATGDLFKFLVLTSAAAYGAVAYLKNRKQETEKLQKKGTNNERVEIYSDEKINISNFKCNIDDDKLNKMSFIIRIKQLLHNNPNIDTDDLEWDYDYMNLSHHIRVSDDDDNRKVKLSIELPVKLNREYLKVADKIVNEFKVENNISPHIRREGYRVELSDDDDVYEWTEIEGYRSFMDLVNTAKDYECVKLFYSVSIRKDQITPQRIAELIERLLNNDEFENGIQFGPAIFVDENGDW